MVLALMLVWCGGRWCTAVLMVLRSMLAELRLTPCRKIALLGRVVFLGVRVVEEQPARTIILRQVVCLARVIVSLTLPGGSFRLMLVTRMLGLTVLNLASVARVLGR